MATFHPIRAERLWTPNVRSLGHLAKVLAVYVLTCRHRDSEGLFVLPMEYVGFDTGLDIEEVKVGFQELEHVGRIEYDPETEVVFDRTALHHHSPNGRAQLQGAVNQLKRLPTSPRVVGFLADLAEIAATEAPNLARALGGSYTEFTTDRKTGELRSISIEGHPLFPFGRPQLRDTLESLSGQSGETPETLSREELSREEKSRVCRFCGSEVDLEDYAGAVACKRCIEQKWSGAA